jgi:NADH/NAD ratio-sensing transcriptional regulator Rex
LQQKELGVMQVAEATIPTVVIFRLAEYHCLLSELMKNADKDRITSKEIAAYLGFTEEVVRKDLSYIPYDTGTPGVGYDIRKLYEGISKILHIDRIHKTALIGSTSTWRGVFNFFDPRKYGFQPVVVFSEMPVDEGLYFDGIPVKFIEDLTHELPEEVKIAIIACDPVWVKRAAQLAVEAGITGILNLTPTVLENIPEGVYVSQVLLPCEIKLVIYHLMEGLFTREGERLKRDIGKRASQKRKKK